MVVSKIHDPENYSLALEKGKFPEKTYSNSAFLNLSNNLEDEDNQFCASGWVYLDHTKKCYKHFSAKSSWTAALKECEALFPDKASPLASAPNKDTIPMTF